MDEISLAELSEQQRQDICTRQNICDQDPRIVEWKVDYSNGQSLDNMIQ